MLKPDKFWFVGFAVMHLCGCAPQWPQAIFGPHNPCLALYEADNLVRASIAGWNAPVTRTLAVAPRSKWYTPIRLEVDQARVGTLSGGVLTYHGFPIDQDSLHGTKLSRHGDTRAWVFIRRTTDPVGGGDAFWTAGSGIGVILADGSVKFPNGQYATEDAFLAEVDAARARLECAFNPNLVLGSQPSGSGPANGEDVRSSDGGP